MYIYICIRMQEETNLKMCNIANIVKFVRCFPLLLPFRVPCLIYLIDFSTFICVSVRVRASRADRRIVYPSK